MANIVFNRLIYAGLFLLMLPALAMANKSVENVDKEILTGISTVDHINFQDTIPRVKPKGKKSEGKKPEEKKPEVERPEIEKPEVDRPEVDRPDIKEVPRSRRQLKPRVVVPERIKVKPPVRVPRPKISTRSRL